jgi:hypothetical protein
MNSQSELRKNRKICVPFTEDAYNAIVSDASEFRAYLDNIINKSPELFPPEISSGYLMKDICYSKKLSIPVRRIRILGTAYTIRPSFVMPYMAGMTKEVEHAMFLRKFNVPFWALAHVFGKDHMYWYRIEKSLGRNSIVGTTVRNPANLPVHLVADEKHTWLTGNRIYVATTAARGCVLGASVATSADEESLEYAYGVFKEEALDIAPEYTPETVCTDGWIPTRKAWEFLFPGILIILCFLHIYIKIRDRTKKEFRDIFAEMASRLWNCFRAPDRASFSQRVRRLCEWGEKASLPSEAIRKLRRLRNGISSYIGAYDHPLSHRTTNMADRLMQRMDRHLFGLQYFHGTLHSAELSIRAWALILNFAPSNPATITEHNGLRSPAERLNGFRYSESWLENLLISASMGGYRLSPQKAL